MNFTSTVAVGRIGKHPPKVKTAGRSSYAGFHIAVNHGYGERKTVSWYHVRLWGKAGDAFERYAEPGQEVLVRGEFRQEKWKDKQGNPKEMWVLHCWDGELGQKPHGSSGGGQRGDAKPQGDYGDYSDAKPSKQELIDDQDVPF